MGVDTTVLMDHTASNNEGHDDYANNNNNNNNNNNKFLKSWQCGPPRYVHITTCLRVTADLTFIIIFKSAFIV